MSSSTDGKSFNSPSTRYSIRMDFLPGGGGLQQSKQNLPKFEIPNTRVLLPNPSGTIIPTAPLKKPIASGDVSRLRSR